jgi:hypothetical protein
VSQCILCSLSVSYEACIPQHLNCDPSTFSPFDYIKINDYVEEWYASEASEKKVLLLVIHTDNQGETL